MNPCELNERLLQALFVVSGLGSCLGQSWWRAVRERNYCRELLAREQLSHIAKQNETLQRSIERQNELLKILATAFASAEPVTLDDLLSHAERDWSLSSSSKPPTR